MHAYVHTYLHMLIVRATPCVNCNNIYAPAHATKTHTQLHTRTHTHTHTHAQRHTCTRTHTRIHSTNTHTAHPHTRTHTCTHAHTHTYTHTPTHAHTHPRNQRNRLQLAATKERMELSERRRVCRGCHQVQHAPELLSQEHLDEWRLLLQGLQQPLQQPLPQKTCDQHALQQPATHYITPQHTATHFNADEHVSLLFDYAEQPTAKTRQPVPLHYAEQAIETTCQVALPVSAATPPNVISVAAPVKIISVATPVHITHSTDALAPSLPTNCNKVALLHGRLTLHEDASQCDPHSAVITMQEQPLFASSAIEAHAHRPRSICAKASSCSVSSHFPKIGRHIETHVDTHKTCGEPPPQAFASSKSSAALCVTLQHNVTHCNEMQNTASTSSAAAETCTTDCNTTAASTAARSHTAIAAADSHLALLRSGLQEKGKNVKDENDLIHLLNEQTTQYGESAGGGSGGGGAGIGSSGWVIRLLQEEA